MEQTTFWVTATSNGSLLSNSLDEGQTKTEELASVFNQPTVMNFATIFAGASASIANTGSSIPGQTVPSLNQIGISPSKRTATLIPISNLQPVTCITQGSHGPGSLTPTTTPIVNAINGADSLTPVTTVYTLPLLTDAGQIPKNFIQQAAAESGLTSDNLTNGRNPIYLTSNPDHGSQTYEINVSTTANNSDSPSGTSSSENTIAILPLQNEAFVCGECGKSFENGGQLSYHTFVAHGELQARPHKCTACPESFLTELHLSDHMRALHLPAEQGGGPPFMCSECLEVFDDGCNLNFHLYIAHTIQGSKSKQLQFPCPECGKMFPKSVLLTAHIRDVHNTTISTITPTTISSGLTVLPASDTVTSYKCKDCGKAFKTQSYLKQHVMAVHNKPLKCSLCGRGFGRKSDLKRHTRGVHMKKRPHVCDKCGWTFSEIGNLKHHIQAVHRKQKNFRCMYCDKTFALPSYLRTHLIRMHSVDIETLKAASENEKETETFAVAPSQLSQAQQQDSISDAVNSSAVISLTTSGSRANAISLEGLQINIAQVVRCYECCQTFDNAQQLQEHVMSSHSQPFWCTLCGEGFSAASHLQLHLQLRHSDMEQQPLQQHSVQTVQAIDLQRNSNGQISFEIRNPVPVSGTISAHAMPVAPKQHILPSQPSAVEAPVEVSPPNQDLPPADGVKCNDCGGVYDSNDDKHFCWKKEPTLANFLSTDDLTVMRERPHLCNACGKRFKTLTHLKQHVRCVHSKEKPHKCRQCEKSFARTSDLNRHIKGVHEKMRQSRNGIFVTIKCSECGAMFAETSQLKRHIYTQHLHGKPSFKCADCQEGFKNELSFQNHICHEEERPHVCMICAKRFQRIQQLRRHSRAAHGRHHEEPQIHKCFQCERVFGRPIDLERHIQAVHLKEKPHKCTICTKSFGLQGNLNKHVRAVHLLEKPHQCVECGKRFAHVGVLKRHLRDIHFYDKKSSVKQRLAAIQMKKARAIVQNAAANNAESSQNRQRTDNLSAQNDMQDCRQTITDSTVDQSSVEALGVSASVAFTVPHQLAAQIEHNSSPARQCDVARQRKVSA